MIERRLCAIVVSLLAFVVGVDHGFYVPGVAPVEFVEGENIEVKAIKLTSVKTQLPYEYYTLGFCQPETIKYASENLGEVLRGDRIVNTPFQVQMKTEVTCKAVCGDKEHPTELTVAQTDLMIKRITEQYHAHLLVDNMPCATRVKTTDGQDALFDHGYRLGYVADDGSVYLNTHLTLVLHYHQHESQPNVYRVVGFEVEPRSVDTKALKFNAGVCAVDELSQSSPLKLTPGNVTKMLWTYSVRWEASEVGWASRWDTYLAMSDVQIHWFSIVNSIVVVFCLSGFLSVILIRTVRRDIAQYNNDDDELDETMEESGWKLVHGDVFRPPNNPRTLTALIGSGIQLLAMALITISFAMLGMLSPASRGSLMTAALFLYCFMGLFSGYWSGRLYKTLRGVQWKRTAVQTALLFPVIMLGSGFMLNWFLIAKKSSGAVPFPTMLLLLFMLGGIDLPLVFIGFYFGYRKQAYQHPVRTNQIPRQVPEQPWYMQLLPWLVYFDLALSGVLPFGAMFIELFFVFSALWENQFYYLFGFLFLVTVILMISCAQISIVVTYFQLCSENYHWWWRSYLVGGSSAAYVYAYSIFYYATKLEIVDFIPTLLYFSYTALIAISFAFITSTVGFYASYWFVCKIYGAVKID